MDETSHKMGGPAISMKKSMMEREAESFTIYAQILEDTFGKIDTPYGDPSQRDPWSETANWTDDIGYQKDDEDVTGVRDNTRRRLRRIHTHRRRGKRH